MADKIELEIVTPTGRSLRASVDEVTAPSVKGEFGVLPGHLPVVAALRAGLVNYRRGSETTRVAVGPGFAEAGQNKLLILADDFIERKDVDPVIVRKEIAEIQPRLEKLLLTSSSSTEVESERKSLIDRENWLATLLELYGDPPPATMRPFEEWGPPPSALTEEEEPPPGDDVPMTGSP